MTVVEALNQRHSVRAFKPVPVPKETLTQILEAATRAPSWGNTQPWELVVAAGESLERLRQEYLARHQQGIAPATDLPRPQSWPPELQQRMQENGARLFVTAGIGRDDQAARARHTRRNFEFFNAPVVVYLCMDRSLTPWSVFDLGMLAQSLMLAAQQYGVDSMPAVNLVAYPDAIRSELKLPDKLAIIMGIALGYTDPDEAVNQHRSTRRPLEEAVRWYGL